ncbi:ParB N-terminal domain-containing protein [Xanthobacter autotrophicus]|uniref:ParB N-terminal domain-containing protein n=1 Tax=Xanthobacter autotrophicus TaxID=280 RepID=UPI00372AD88D
MPDILHIEQITTLNRIRQAAPRQVAALAESIKDVGLLNPITVVPTDGGFALIAGLNRLEACRSLGWEEIAANVVDLDEQQRIIAECDENLRGSVLTAAEKAVFLARRKEAYEVLHPEAKAQVRQGHIRQGAAADKLAVAFTADTAAKTGRDERTIRRDVARGEKVCAIALELVQGTKLDTGAYLDALKKLSPEEQAAKVKSDLNAPDAPKKGAPKSAATSVPDPEPQPAPESPSASDPAEVRLRKDLAKLTHEGLVDEAVGLHLENAEMREKVDALKNDIDDLKTKIRDYQTDNLGASVGKLQRQCDQMRFARDEAMKTAKREEYKRKQAEKRVIELEAMGIPLNP